jgi:hypothetical protein
MSDPSNSTLWRQAQDGSWEWQAPDGRWHPAPPQSGPPPPPGSVVTTEPQSTMPAGAWLAIAGGVLGVVSAFLPWVTFTSGFGNVARDSLQLARVSWIARRELLSPQLRAGVCVKLV